MIIEKRLFDKHGREIGYLIKDSDKIRLSFLFEDGDNWHFQLKRGATKKELKDALFGVAQLIDETLKL